MENELKLIEEKIKVLETFYDKSMKGAERALGGIQVLRELRDELTKKLSNNES